MGRPLGFSYFCKSQHEASLPCRSVRFFPKFDGTEQVRLLSLGMTRNDCTIQRKHSISLWLLLKDVRELVCLLASEAMRSHSGKSAEPVVEHQKKCHSFLIAINTSLPVLTHTPFIREPRYISGVTFIIRGFGVFVIVIRGRDD